MNIYLIYKKKNYRLIFIIYYLQMQHDYFKLNQSFNGLNSYSKKITILNNLKKNFLILYWVMAITIPNNFLFINF